MVHKIKEGFGTLVVRTLLLHLRINGHEIYFSILNWDTKNVQLTFFSTGSSVTLSWGISFTPQR